MRSTRLPLRTAVLFAALALGLLVDRAARVEGKAAGPPKGVAVSLSGRVFFTDGKPAAGIPIRAVGMGYARGGYHGKTTTDAEGRYELPAKPNLVYVVVAGNDRWAAAPRTGFAVFADRPVKEQDFRLRPATRVQGRLTLGADRRPQAGRRVSLLQWGKRLAPGVELPGREKNTRMTPTPRLHREAVTDEDGRYEFFVGPGEYHLNGLRQVGPKNFTVADEKTLVFDIHAPHPETGLFRGLVVAGNPPKPVAGADVTGYARSDHSFATFTAKTDAGGRFEVRRQLQPTLVIARLADKRLAGSVEVTADDATVTLPLQAMVSARGRLVDSEGNPLAGRTITAAAHITLDEATRLFFSLKESETKTDAEGRFEASRLVVGLTYDVQTPLEEGTKREKQRYVAKVAVKGVKPIDLGDVVLTIPDHLLPIEKRTEAAFRSPKTYAERFASAAQHARLCKQSVLVVIADPKAEAAQKFFALRFEDEKIIHALYSFAVVAIPPEEKALAAAQDFARGRKVALAKTPLVVVFDANGAQLARAEIAPLLADGKLMAFLEKHAPATLDARELLADALARAKKENKRVFVQETATWCGPCYRLSLFLDAQRAVWSKDYVWVKIDRRWAHAEEVMKALRKGAEGGIPWHAVLDADGKVLATCNGKDGKNIGFPSEGPEIAHFVGMFEATALRLTAREIAALRRALEKQ